MSLGIPLLSTLHRLFTALGNENTVCLLAAGINFEHINRSRCLPLSVFPCLLTWLPSLSYYCLFCRFHSAPTPPSFNLMVSAVKFSFITSSIVLSVSQPLSFNRPLDYIPCFILSLSSILASLLSPLPQCLICHLTSFMLSPPPHVDLGSHFPLSLLSSFAWHWPRSSSSFWLPRAPTLFCVCGLCSWTEVKSEGSLFKLCACMFIESCYFRLCTYNSSRMWLVCLYLCVISLPTEEGPHMLFPATDCPWHTHKRTST